VAEFASTAVREGRAVRIEFLWSVAAASFGLLFLCVSAIAADPPPMAREFRGVWVATVSNIDWPSKPGLPAAQQKRELIDIFDKAVDLNLNAIVLQIRPSADALYPSKLEPWSQYLTGEMGKPPAPYYDPLEFAVEEAHCRGLQLHVWFNPYRVRLLKDGGKPSADHSSKTRKSIVRKYGDYLWFDPGEPKAIDHFIAVLKDVVRRYDIDGVHIDDYFYPYQIREKSKKKDKKTGKEIPGKIVPFPDEASYRRYARSARRRNVLKRDDWRRENVNRLIERMYDEVKDTKPWVQVGISPFGIWRPDNPKGIKGLDPYSALYADSRKWLQQGWLDYLTPQLYWQVKSEEQSYPRLLGWWAEQNVHGRHLWPGNFTSKVRRSADVEETRDSWSAEELIRQIEVTRSQSGATGNIHFSMKALVRNFDGIADKLKAGLYAEPALVPESSWLGRQTPPRPKISARRDGSDIVVDMKLPREKKPWQWVVRVHGGGNWKTVILSGCENQHVVPLAGNYEAATVIVSAVTRLGRLGPEARAEIKDGN
jgi:uncharacterized lipoprotein YddW (UPF0748 family)